jgi:hypothetical protein
LIKLLVALFALLARIAQVVNLSFAAPGIIARTTNQRRSCVHLASLEMCLANQVKALGATTAPLGIIVRVKMPGPIARFVLQDLLEKTEAKLLKTRAAEAVIRDIFVTATCTKSHVQGERSGTKFFCPTCPVVKLAKKDTFAMARVANQFLVPLENMAIQV